MKKGFQVTVYRPGHIPFEEHRLLSTCLQSQLQELQRIDPRLDRMYQPIPSNKL